jgi:hypothetical protein
MASSFFALFDDIATVLDDVATLAKVAAKKTAGVLGDDLALNAEQITGVPANRELPVVWAVAKGSLLNKTILVPVAVLISAIAPWLIVPLLMVGGAYLCFEGAEKLMHKDVPDDELAEALADPDIDIVEYEKAKIKGAIRTDFVLSAEIIAITLGTVAEEPISRQFMVLTLIALTMTIGVYGFVAAIVKMDDLGLHLDRKPGITMGARFARGFGGLLLKAAPLLMKTLTFVGTIAMFLVGGGIIVHGVSPVYDWIHHMGESASAVAGVGWILGSLTSSLLNGIAGLGVGAALVLLHDLFTKNKVVRT